MKKYLPFLLIVFVAVACKSQVPPNPTSYSCPTSGYTQLNQSSPATGLTYTATPSAPGTYCGIAQSVNGSLVSVASNVAGPYTVTANSGSNQIAFSWTAPTSGVVPTGYIISLAPATSQTINAPALGNASVAAFKKPQKRATCPAVNCANQREQLAKNSPHDLTGSVR